MKMIYELWENRKTILEKGVERKELLRWLQGFADPKRGYLYRDYLEGGIKNSELAEFCAYEGIPSRNLVKKKQVLMKGGMDEKTAEEWLYLHLYEPKVVRLLRGQDLELVRSFVFAKERISAEDIQSFLELLKEHGIEQDLALQEMQYFAEEKWFVFKDEHGHFNREFLRASLSQANKMGFKSLVLWLKIRDDKHKIDKAQERKKFYQSLGLSQVYAEWWTAHELIFHREFSEEQKDIVFSLKRLLDIKRFFYVLSKMAKIGRKEDPQEALEWIKNLLFPYLEYTTLEKAKEWAKFGLLPSSLKDLPEELSPKKFEDLLQESLCTPDELLSWIKEDGIQKVQTWFSLGVKDWQTCFFLENSGLGLDELKRILDLLSIEELIKIFSEKGSKGVQEEYERRLKKRAYKRIVKVFKRK